ncbi:hypothetical protein HDE_04192 [Halotydeus destructor]|nr:hypothetical protein HDE_04192 [Halotydeus destructor]
MKLTVLITLMCFVAINGKLDRDQISRCHQSRVTAAVQYDERSFVIFFGIYYSLVELYDDELIVSRGYPKLIAGSKGYNWFSAPQLAKGIMGAFKDGDQIVIAMTPHAKFFRFNATDLYDIQLIEILDNSVIPESMSAVTSFTSADYGQVLFYWILTQDGTIQMDKQRTGVRIVCDDVKYELGPPLGVTVGNDGTGFAFFDNDQAVMMRMADQLQDSCNDIIFDWSNPLNSSIFKGCDNDYGSENGHKVKRNENGRSFFMFASSSANTFGIGQLAVFLVSWLAVLSL